MRWKELQNILTILRTEERTGFAVEQDAGKRVHGVQWQQFHTCTLSCQLSDTLHGARMSGFPGRHRYMLSCCNTCDP